MSQLSIATSDKTHAPHRDRLAIVYIRQSPPQQVERHQESTRLQYALVDHAVLLGWARERVTVIDEDQRRSGSSAEGRLQAEYERFQDHEPIQPSAAERAAILRLAEDIPALRRAPRSGRTTPPAWDCPRPPA